MKKEVKVRVELTEKALELILSEGFNKFVLNAGAGLQQFIGSKEFLMLGTFGSSLLQGMAKQMAQQMIEEKRNE